MVTKEYPPMQGGVGRYAARLTKSLQKLGLEVYVLRSTISYAHSLII